MREAYIQIPLPKGLEGPCRGLAKRFQKALQRAAPMAPFRLELPAPQDLLCASGARTVVVKDINSFENALGAPGQKVVAWGALNTIRFK